MSLLTESVADWSTNLPSCRALARKSAERLTYHVLRVHKPEALALADAIRNVKENVHYCKVCYNLAEGEQCDDLPRSATRPASCCASSSNRAT